MDVLAREVESLKNRLEATTKENIDLQGRLKAALQNLSSTQQGMDDKLKEHNDLLVQYG